MASRCQVPPSPKPVYELGEEAPKRALDLPRLCTSTRESAPLRSIGLTPR